MVLRRGIACGKIGVLDNPQGHITSVVTHTRMRDKYLKDGQRVLSRRQENGTRGRKHPARYPWWAILLAKILMIPDSI
jgi:hypothetical protein